MIRSKFFKKTLRMIVPVFILFNIFYIVSSNTFFNNLGHYLRLVGRKTDWHDYKFMKLEALRVGPGEKGLPHILNTGNDIDNNERGLLEAGISTIVSEKISLNRSLPDRRLEACKSKTYLKKLPKTSIVIVHFEENWTLLLRCLHSIYNRSPHELLHEIILIDDKSMKTEMSHLVETYIATHFDGKVKMFENRERSGLIVSRVEGAKKATGEVILFLDSHMEVNTNWLPPLLEPIKLNPKTATVPIVSNIDGRTFEYKFVSHGSRGGFDWTMTFKWFPLRSQDLIKRDEPHNFSVMAGGAYAIRKDYFFELGAYDEGMKVWNGENYELSFKIALCGGQLLQIPCSNVAHVVKSRVKYREENYGFDYSARNLKRVAEVWMDEYKEFVYKQDPKKYSIDAGDLTKQFELKKRLNCKPFKYFIEEVAPEIIERYPISERGNFASGAIISDVDPTLCVTEGAANMPLKLAKCSENKTNQDFLLTWNRMIKPNTSAWDCVDVFSLNLISCHFLQGHQLWRYSPETRRLFSPTGNICFTANLTSLEIKGTACNLSDVNQGFTWTYVNQTACASWETYGVPLRNKK